MSENAASWENPTMSSSLHLRMTIKTALNQHLSPDPEHIKQRAHTLVSR